MTEPTKAERLSADLKHLAGELCKRYNLRSVVIVLDYVSPTDKEDLKPFYWNDGYGRCHSFLERDSEASGLVLTSMLCSMQETMDWMLKKLNQFNQWRWSQTYEYQESIRRETRSLEEEKERLVEEVAALRREQENRQNDRSGTKTQQSGGHQNAG